MKQILEIIDKRIEELEGEYVSDEDRFNNVYNQNELIDEVKEKLQELKEEIKQIKERS